MEAPPLENHLHGELNIKRFGGTDAGSTIEVSDRVEGKAKSIFVHSARRSEGSAARGSHD